MRRLPLIIRSFVRLFVHRSLASLRRRFVRLVVRSSFVRCCLSVYRFACSSPPSPSLSLPPSGFLCCLLSIVDGDGEVFVAKAGGHRMLMVARWSTRLERFQRLPEFVCLSGVEWFEIHTSVQWRTQEMNARDVLRVFVVRK